MQQYNSQQYYQYNGQQMPWNGQMWQNNGQQQYWQNNGQQMQWNGQMWQNNGRQNGNGRRRQVQFRVINGELPHGYCPFDVLAYYPAGTKQE